MMILYLPLSIRFDYRSMTPLYFSCWRCRHSLIIIVIELATESPKLTYKYREQVQL